MPAAGASSGGGGAAIAGASWSSSARSTHEGRAVAGAEAGAVQEAEAYAPADAARCEEALAGIAFSRGILFLAVAVVEPVGDAAAAVAGAEAFTVAGAGAEAIAVEGAGAEAIGVEGAGAEAVGVEGAGAEAADFATAAANICACSSTPGGGALAFAFSFDGGRVRARGPLGGPLGRANPGDPACAVGVAIACPSSRGRPRDSWAVACGGGPSIPGGGALVTNGPWPGP